MISNSTPLIFLSKINKLNFLKELFKTVIIPGNVEKEVLKAKLGKVRSNLILRLPKDLEHAFNLEKGESVLIKVEDNGFRIVPA